MKIYLLLILASFSIQLSAQDLNDSILFKDKIVKVIDLGKLGNYRITPHHNSGYYIQNYNELYFYDSELNLVKEMKFKSKDRITMIAFGVGKQSRNDTTYYGFFNDKFELAIPCDYKEIRYKEGDKYLAAFSFDKVWTIFNLNGKEILKLEKGYEPTSKLRDRFTFNAYREKISGVMDIKGNLLLEFKDKKKNVRIYDIREDFLFINDYHNQLILNFNKDTILEIQARVLWYIDENLLQVFYTGRHDKKGYQLIDFEGNPVSENYFITPKNNSQYIYLPSRYYKSGSVEEKENRSGSMILKKYSVYDIEKRKLVATFSAHNIGFCNEKYLTISIDHKVGITDLEGNIIIPPIFDSISREVKGKILVRFAKSPYLLNLN